MTEIKEVDIDNLVIDSAQSRSQQSWGSDESDQQLVKSVGEDGVMNPLMVRPVEMTPFDDDIDEDYSIIAGSRRFKASVEAGLSSVPCQVFEATDLEAAIKSLKENKERKDLTRTEMMASVKLHYEILGGDELKDGYVCEECGNVFDSATGLGRHMHNAHDSKVEFPESKDSVETHRGAVAFIANTHYPDISEKNARAKVGRMLDAVELPSDYQILLKDSDTRSQSEMQKLRELGIDPERKFSISSGANDFDSVIDLYHEVDNIDGLEADRRVLSAIGEIDFNQSNRSVSDRIDQIRESFAEKAEDIESAQEAERKFEQTVDRNREELRRVLEEVGTDRIGSVDLSFEDQKFKRYHALAKQQQKIKSNSEIVRQAYEEYLNKLSDKHNW
jgi:hypothetical protein